MWDRGLVKEAVEEEPSLMLAGRGWGCTSWESLRPYDTLRAKSPGETRSFAAAPPRNICQHPQLKKAVSVCVYVTFKSVSLQ